MSNIEKLDNFQLPEDVTDADAEYILICISRCSDAKKTEKYRSLLKDIQQALLVKHNELKRKHNVKKSI